jgi:hypothetical protein
MTLSSIVGLEWALWMEIFHGLEIAGHELTLEVIKTFEKRDTC